MRRFSPSPFHIPMPDDDRRPPPGLYLLIGGALLMALIVVLYRIHRQLTQRAPAAPRHPHVTRMFANQEAVPGSMGRMGFSTGLRHQISHLAAQAQVNELMRYGHPGTVATAQAVFEDEILSQPHAAEFQVRHVLADSFLRRSVIAVLRMGSDPLAATVREVFVAFGSHQLVNLWDDVWSRARGTPNWYTAVGRDHIKALRRALTDVRGNLFLSEHQSNVAAGTHVDVTPDAIGTLGDVQIRNIVAAGVKLMHELGLEPRLVALQDEIMLGYTGSAGGFFWAGFNPRRSRDRQVDPLTLLDDDQAQVVWNNTPPNTRLKWCFLWQPLKCIAALVLLFMVVVGIGQSMRRALG